MSRNLLLLNGISVSKDIISEANDIVFMLGWMHHPLRRAWLMPRPEQNAPQSAKVDQSLVTQAAGVSCSLPVADFGRGNMSHNMLSEAGCVGS